MAEVKISKFIPTIKTILKNSDPNKITARDIRMKLEKDFKVDLAPRKHEVQQLIEQCFDEINEDSVNSSDSLEDFEDFDEVKKKKKKKHHSDEKSNKSSSKSSKKSRQSKTSIKSNGTSDYSSLEDDDYKSPQKKKKRGRKPKSSTELLSDGEYERKFEKELNGSNKKSKSTTKKKKHTNKRKRNDDDDDDDGEDNKKKKKTGIHKPLVLSPVLSEFLHVEELSRLEVVKRLWVYIKENSLQDPNDKRFIVCDDNLKNIFKQDRIHSFTMNKYLTDHLKKKEDLIGGETFAVSSNGSHQMEPSNASSAGDDELQNDDEFDGTDDHNYTPTSVKIEDDDDDDDDDDRNLFSDDPDDEDLMKTEKEESKNVKLEE